MPCDETTEEAEAILDAIATAATGPKQVTTDGMTVEAHSLADLIEAHKYLADCPASGPRRGIRFSKLVPEGSI